MSLVQTVHLTIGNYKSPMVVPAVQNDSDRQLKMIVDDFTLSNSMTGKMTFKRADGTFYEAEATLALADNAFVAELDQALTCPGRTLAQLKVTATDTVSTFAFIVWVEADTSGTLTPQEGISLSEAVQRAEDAAERAEEAAESGGGLTDNIKNALLQIARKVAYIDEHGQDYYDDLYDALYEVTGLTLDVTSISLWTIGATSQITATTIPSGAEVTWVSSDTSVATVSNGLVTAVGYGSATITASAGNLTAQCSVVIAQATVTSISAVYTPSGSIYETNIPALDTLKNDLVVTAHWSNGTTSTVTDYALSGTLSAGSNTITVSYGGQTTTITVTVVALSSISAVYTQSGTVYDTASLDDLKADLVVTANFADSTTQTVTEYTLSGTLAEGTSTITVSYAGKTTTFNVTVSVYDTSPIIATENYGLNMNGGAGSYTGLGITQIYRYQQDLDAIHASQYYDAANDYITNGQAIPRITLVRPRTNFDELYPGAVGLGNVTKNHIYKEGDVYVSYASGDVNYGVRNDSVGLQLVGVAFTLYLPDIDDSYAYWMNSTTAIYPVGVHSGDIVFAGRNTPYYGLHNISEAETT